MEPGRQARVTYASADGRTSIDVTQTAVSPLLARGHVVPGEEAHHASTKLADTTPIAELTEEQEVIVVPAKSPYQTVQDLVDDIKANGQDVSIAGGSAGGTDHILAGMLLKNAGIAPEDIAKSLNYVPFSGGGESLAALLGKLPDVAGGDESCAPA